MIIRAVGAVRAVGDVGAVGTVGAVRAVRAVGAIGAVRAFGAVVPVIADVTVVALTLPRCKSAKAIVWMRTTNLMRRPQPYLERLRACPSFSAK